MKATRRKERGSRKHILDWVEQTWFPDRLSALLEPTGAKVESGGVDMWMPEGRDNPEEARLHRFGPQVLPGVNWPELGFWWLVFQRGANTPNWDLASTCTVGGRRGLVLVEAKAHAGELKTQGKELSPVASARPLANHDRIGKAIEEAGRALGATISRDTHYQLANRMAFGWKVASLGVPVVLVYLGFLGDTSMSDVGEPFRDDQHWRQELGGYIKGIVPEVLLERWTDCGSAQMCMIVRSMRASLA